MAASGTQAAPVGGRRPPVSHVHRMPLLQWRTLFLWLAAAAALAGPWDGPRMADGARKGQRVERSPGSRVGFAPDIVAAVNAGVADVNTTVNVRSPWVAPPKTEMKALGAAAYKCLEGKHVQLIGNSVTRHWLFLLNDLLNSGGPNLDVETADFQAMRRQEKEMCGSSEDPSHIDGTGCSAQPRNGSVRLQFVWQHPFHSKVLNASLRSRPAPDVIIANLGINDLYHPEKRPTWKSMLISRTERLAETFNTLPDSTYVFWRTTTRLCDPPSSSAHTESRFFPIINRCLQVSNAHMLDALARRAPKVHIFDAFELTRDCRGYNDHIHHPVAAVDHVLLFMSQYCGASFGLKALAAYPHLGPHMDTATGAVRPRQCLAQRAGVPAVEGAIPTEAEGQQWGDGWDWVSALHSVPAGPQYKVAC